MIQNKILDRNAINIDSMKKNMDNNSSSTRRRCNNIGYKMIKIKCIGKTTTLKEKVERETDDYQKEKKKIETMTREQPEKLGMTLRCRNRLNYKRISKPKHIMLIQLSIKLKNQNMLVKH